jgi:hypothetical protein
VARITKFPRFFFAQLRTAEDSYNGDSDSENDSSNEEATNDWFTWTKILVQLAQDLNTTVDGITSQTWVKTLFWLYFFNEKRAEEWQNLKT